jgi:arylsulfatase A-like enzyme
MALVLGAVLICAACGSGPPQDELDQELDRLLRRTRDLAALAAHFDHDRTLHGIGVDRANGTLYRLDEHLEEVSHKMIDEGRADLRPVLATVDVAGGSRRSEEIIAYPVDLPTRDINTLELELTSPLLGRLEIELQGEDAGEALTIEFPLVGDGLVHTYRLEVAETLASWASERLVRLRVRVPKHQDAARLEIRSARFLGLTSAFADADYGATHHRHGGETRRSVFQWSSSVLRFPVHIESPVEAELELGGTAILTGRPVRAEITLVRGSDRGDLLSTTLEAGDGWTDWRLPLGKLDSGDTVIELRVSADVPNIVLWSNPAVVSRPERRFNVIMVLEDALRADHLSCYGYDRPTTPVKDAFARRGVRFASCYAQATKTRFSCPSFMTSLYPTATGVEGIWNLHGALDENYLTLAEVLRRRGYVTASIHQNPNAGSPAGLHQGFSYLFENVPGRAEELYTGLPLRWIEEHDHRNFLLYLHLADPHEPYHPPEGFRAWFEELSTGVAGGETADRLDRQDPRWMEAARRALYDGEIRFNDYWFAVFLEHLDDLGLTDDTLIVFMSDHGEHLGEHGRWSHNPPGYVQVLHTPLIMVSPRRIQAGLVVDEIVQNLDIMPTILDLAAVDGGSLLMQGDSLLPLMTEGAPTGWSRNLGYSEEALVKKSRHDPRPYGSVFFGRWHLLDSVYASMALFDLELDPAERNQLRSSRELRGRIPAFLRDMQQAELEIWRRLTGERQTAVSLDHETISVLKALGYLE